MVRITGPHIAQLCRNNRKTLETVHHGLSDIRLGRISHHLTIPEILAFGHGSYQIRSKACDYDTCSSNFHEFFGGSITQDGKNSFQKIVQEGSLYDMISMCYKGEGVRPFYQPFALISPVTSKKDMGLVTTNASLQERLEDIPEEVVDQLRARMLNQVGEYVFNCAYHDTKALRKGDNHNLHIMDFQDAYPKKDKLQKITNNYAKEIGKMLTHWAGLEPFEKKVIPPTNKIVRKEDNPLLEAYMQEENEILSSIPEEKRDEADYLIEMGCSIHELPYRI
ncbi:MAG: hypothetical protein ACMXYK_00800 [Candidatus Woesearchaeota archaeon]